MRTKRCNPAKNTFVKVYILLVTTDVGADSRSHDEEVRPTDDRQHLNMRPFSRKQSPSVDAILVWRSNIHRLVFFNYLYLSVSYKRDI